MLDLRIKAEVPFIENAPTDWLERELQAIRFMQRARLSGDFADLVTAGDLLKQGFAHADPNTGPHMTAAGYAMAVHRMIDARAMLDALDRYAIPPDASQRADAMAMRGEIAIYSGDYAKARAALDQAFATSGGTPQPVRMGLLLAKTGDPDGALAAIDAGLRAGPFMTAQVAADLHYQIGLIELGRGRWPEAEAAFTDADRLFAGHWRFLEALAQMHALRGDTNGASALFTKAIAATSNPEPMDMFAALFRAQGDRANAELWAGRAATGWGQWLQALPEAAYAHATDHELAFGSPVKALALAQANYQSRPYGGAAVALGWALLANGRAADAATLIEKVNASGWQTYEQHLVGARAYELLRQSDKAEIERAAALALNPRAFDPAGPLIWIGH